MKEVKVEDRELVVWMVTGTFHGSWIYAKSEGDARRAFHKTYNGESIVDIYARKLREEYNGIGKYVESGKGIGLTK